MTRAWWQDEEHRQDAEEAAAAAPVPAAPASPAGPTPGVAQLVEHRASLQRKLMIMRSRSPDRRAVERALVKATAELLRAGLREGAG
ncbi:MAG: hypothetical protein WDM94_09340 [Bauldia sp.]